MSGRYTTFRLFVLLPSLYDYLSKYSHICYNQYLQTVNNVQHDIHIALQRTSPKYPLMNCIVIIIIIIWLYSLIRALASPLGVS
jgi:hypothetical protein